MGTDTPNLSPRAKYAAQVIRQRIHRLDDIRGGFIVVLREASKVLAKEHCDLAAALNKLGATPVEPPF